MRGDKRYQRRQPRDLGKVRQVVNVPDAAKAVAPESEKNRNSGELHYGVSRNIQQRFDGLASRPKFDRSLNQHDTDYTRPTRNNYCRSKIRNKPDRSGCGLRE
jgi:hypothetical protein